MRNKASSETPASSASGQVTHEVYFRLDGSGLEYELYNIGNDSDEFHNLLYGTPTTDLRKEWSRLHKLLTRRLIETGNLPDSFAWPITTALA